MNVTALIVTYNRLNKLTETVMATRRLPFQHIIIVNNASSDGTREWLRTVDDPRIKILDKINNNGGAGGFHYGAEFISRNIITDWVIFYDDDAYPSSEFMERFISLKPNAYEIYCSVVRNPKGEICSMNLPWKSKTSTFLDNLNYLRKPSSFIADPKKSSTVITFSFVGVVIPAKVLSDTFNYIKEELFIYYDDVYYSAYLNSLGYKINFSNKLEFIHDTGVVTSWDSQEWKIYYLSRNLFLSKSLYNGCDYFSLTAKLFRIIKYLLIGITCKNKIKYYTFLIKGILHGIRRIGGYNH